MLQADWNPQGGFSFKNCQRNAFLESSLKGLRVPHARKTGTTIAGLVFQDGVILGADTRATNDSVVADKNCEKIHFIAPNIYCCGAGVAADAEMTTQMMASNMELHALSTGRKPRVVTVTRMLRQMLFRYCGTCVGELKQFWKIWEGGRERECLGWGWKINGWEARARGKWAGWGNREVGRRNDEISPHSYQGHIGASLIVGGVDITGPLLYSVHPHGSYSRLLFTALGSGQEAAISVLEDRFKPNMTLEEGQQLIVEAVTAGILDDLGSGSNVDMCVITQAGAKIQRAVSTPAVISKRQGKYRYPKGTTAVMKETVTPLALEMIEETVQTMEVE
ncbi:proteasome subunit beta type-10 isoform X1 [Sarcophilus harrisii]|uniref:proteasome subunit beta type-10 isoform X1 n=1 Tax=Sarcophilus harrisii TaxID=9305 RepID=UPI00062BD272|nr:proteasome subunit beta type-10 isoform X1 [Sarcophilus harrisii]